MSEKRFSLEYYDNMPYVKDNSNDEDYYLHWAVELMNELYEENEELKKRLYLYEISEDQVDKYLRTHPMPTRTNERTITPLDMRHKRY